MTIKEAILNTLNDLVTPQSYIEITDYILKQQYAKFGGETPHSTVSALCGDFIRNGDTRVRRIKEKGTYFYYLAKNEQLFDTDNFGSVQNESAKKEGRIEKDKAFVERDLHILLSSYLKSLGIYSKTIFHEQSNSRDNNQTWTHPDMVGIRFHDLQNKTCQNFIKLINQVETFDLNSYELKKELNNDSELKKAYFQTVSNSSWANYGYLVAFEISDSLLDEIERLNQSFGIGIIKLNATPFQSKILFQAKHRELDFKTIDKLCKLNKDFEKFIEQTEKLMTAEDRYYKATEKELDEFCDDYFNNDTEIQKYCKNKKIPIDEI